MSDTPIIQRRNDTERSERFSGKKANEFGWSNEEAVACCFEAHPEKYPSWMRCVRRASSEEDRQGIDVIVETYDTYDIGIQVKSSVRASKIFSEHHTDIPVITVSDNDTDISLCAKIIKITSKIRKEYLG